MCSHSEMTVSWSFSPGRSPLAGPSIPCMAFITSHIFTLGIFGVNLVHAAFHLAETPESLIASLMDDLTPGRIIVDMIRFSGPAFPGVDNRIMSLQLVVQGLTKATLFRSDGEVVQAADAFYNKPLLVERGSFRPVTHITNDMLDCARRSRTKGRRQ